MKTEITQIAVKTSPPAAVSAWSWITGQPIQNWVAAATLLYLAIQIYVLVRDKIVTRNGS